MTPDRYPHRIKATQMLLLATILWGISFPTMKALSAVEGKLLPGASTWFVTALAVSVRFGLSALLMLPLCWSTLRQLSRNEVSQGLGLAVFGGLGLLFQMDGLNYTPASTSAFLTQFYCILLPVIVSVRERRRPSGLIMVCTVMVIVGVAVLAELDWRDLKLGRGEWETLIGSLFFTGQILWLDRPSFASNRVMHFSLVMFAVMAVLPLPVAVATMRSPQDFLAAYASPSAAFFMAILVLLCTLGAYMMMNFWQPKIPPAEAGLVYTAEPVFASLFALFVPRWYSSLAGIEYANEHATFHLVVGGGLITAANVLLQLRPAKQA